MNVKKVLVVDDELDLCQIVKKQLESIGEFEVTFCTNGTEAFELSKQLRPDVILLDVAMPDLSGPKIAKQLADDPETKNIPFIYLTGMVSREEVKESRNLIGGNYFIAKPFLGIADVMRVIDMALGKKG